MQKAFDSVNRELLLFNLICFNVDGKFYRNLKEIYTDTQACVIINGIFTDWFKTNTGVLQGDVLSPVLFNTFINNLAEKLQESGSGIPIKTHRISNLMYADDIVLLAGCARDLQALLDIVKQWCHKWQLKINETKTNIVHFRKQRKKVQIFDLRSTTLC
jgi:retron-type reverse transcriptase